MSATRAIRTLTGRRSNKIFDKLAIDSVDAPKTGGKGGKLAYEIFDINDDVAKQSLETKFIQGIKTGRLDPNEYGGYTVQDAIYCYHGTENLDTLEKKARSEGLPDLEAFATLKAQGYKEYAASMFHDWHINDPRGIDLGEAASNYLRFSRSVLSGFPPYYMIIAMLPCDMLWEWLGQQLKGYVSDANVYSFWIEGNLPGSTSWEDFVDGHTQKYDKEIANQIFRIAMISELNFFRSGCGEKLETVPKMPDPPSAC